MMNQTQINSSLLAAVNVTSVPETENNTLCNNLLFEYVGLTIFLITIYAVVIIIGFVGNTLIIYIVITKKSLRSSTNLFLVNMAICGIGVVCFLIPKKVSEVFTGQWVWSIDGNIGRALCKIVPFIHDVFMDCSTYSLLLITFDRFCAVVFPHKRWMASNRHVSAMIALSWAVSVIVNVVLLKVFDVRRIKSDPGLYCYPVWRSTNDFFGYIYTFITVNLILPMILIPIAYAMIFRKLKKQTSILSHSISEQQQVQESLRQRRIVYMAFAIVCCFAICWIPFAIQVLITTVYLVTGRRTLPCPFLRYREVSYYFLVLVSVTNPVICFIFHFAFREQLKLIYHRVCCRKRVGDSDTVTRNQIGRNKTEEDK